MCSIDVAKPPNPPPKKNISDKYLRPKLSKNFKCVRKLLSTTVQSFLKGFPIENTRLCLEGKRTSCLQYLHGFTTNNALERNIFKCELVELKVVNVLSPRRCFVCNDLATLCPYMMQHYGPGQSFVNFFFFFILSSQLV